MSDRLSPSLAVLKELDPERYLACLYLPDTVRDDIATLWAFDADIARIPNLVSEPMPGEIRLQWWRDLISSGDNAGAGPLAGRLSEVINAHDLPPGAFQNYLDARAFDLYNDPMPDMPALEGYLGETVSVWFQMAALCCGADQTTELANACGHAGMAVGMSRMLSNNARYRARQQVYLPYDIIEASGLSCDEWLSSEPANSHEAVIRQSIVLARDHLAKAQQVTGSLQRETKPVFLSLALVGPTLKKIENHLPDVFAQPLSLSPLARNWHMFRAALRK